MPTAPTHQIDSEPHRTYLERFTDTLPGFTRLTVEQHRLRIQPNSASVNQRHAQQKLVTYQKKLKEWRVARPSKDYAQGLALIEDLRSLHRSFRDIRNHPSENSVNPVLVAIMSSALTAQLYALELWFEANKPLT